LGEDFIFKELKVLAKLGPLLGLEGGDSTKVLI